MLETLKLKVIYGILWSMFERIGQQGLQLIITIVISRFLLPEDFGLIAMLTIFLAISQTLMESGFGAAIIQNQNTNYVDECSVFNFNIFTGVLLASLMCLSAPIIAEFYDQEILVYLTYAMSTNLIINSFSLIQSVLLVKNLDFKTQFKVSLISTFISGILALLMAYYSFGVWSLVVLYLSNSLFRTIFLWLISSWRPSFIFKFSSLKKMFNFGSRLLVTGIMESVFQNMYFVVIGKVISPISLGFYYYAHKLQQLPVQNISTIVGRVTFPVFSSLQDNQTLLKQYTKKAITMQMLIYLPLIVGLAIVAKPMIIVLLTDKWLQSVPYLQLLCFVGLLYPIHTTSLNIIKSQGNANLFLKLEIINKILFFVILILTYKHGIISMIYGQIVVSFIITFISSFFSGKIINYSVLEQVKDIFPISLVTLLMVVAMLFIGEILNCSDFFLLITQVALGIVIYSFLCYIFKVSSFLYLVNSLKSKIN